MKVNRKILIGLIVSAVLLAGAAGMFGYSLSVTNRQTDLGADLSGYSITKMYTDNLSVRIVGTQSGEVFAIDMEGQTLWNVGKPKERAVYDIAMANGNVYVVYADGSVISFAEEDAAAYSAEEGGSFLDSCRQYSAGLSFNSNGNVKNTQLLVSADGAFFLLRGMFNDVSRINRIYRFDAESGESQQIVATSGAVGGLALAEDGTFYYATKSAIYGVSPDAAPVQLADINETVTALALSGEQVFAVTELNNLFRLPVQSPDAFESYSLGVNLSSDFVFSTGENFVAKINNGGVAIISSSEHRVTLKMRAANSANLVMWSEESFVLRDESDITNPIVNFYLVSLAKTVALFSTLLYVFLAVMTAALLATLYFAFGMSERFRRAINRKIGDFFRALNRYKKVYLCLVVPFALLVTFYYIPIVLGFGLSFFDYIPGERSVFVGFKNVVTVVQNPEFWSSSLTMLIFLAADLLKALIPPIILAEAIMALKLQRFSLWVRILLFLPGVLPGVATVLVWSSGVFGATENSLVNAFIGLFVPGFVKNWVNSASAGTAIGTLIAFGFPWIGSYLIFFGAISGINTSVFESAKLDGCGWIKRIATMDIPLIMPQIKYIFVTSFIASVQNYTNLFVLYGVDGQIKTPALLMYREIINANYGTASVMGVFIFLFLSVATFFNFRMQSDKS